MLRRLARDLGERTVWLGPGAPARLRELAPAARVVQGVDLADVAIATVVRVSASGVAPGNLGVRAKEVWALAGPRPWGEADPDESTFQVRRLITPVALLELVSEGWRVREVAPGVSARDVQSECPFTLRCGSDLQPLRA